MGLAAGILFMVGFVGSQLSGVANFVNLKLQNRQNIEQVFQTIVTEIRSMGPSSIGGYAINAATSTSITFFSDVDRDGIFERVRYFLGTSTLERGLVEPTGNPLVYATSTEVVSPVISSVIATSSVFEYFDSSYTGGQAAMTYPLNISAIRIVRLTLTADINPGQAPTPTVFTSTVNPRNLRTN